MRKVRGRKRDMIDREVEFHLGAYKGSGAELIMGNGHFLGPIEVALNVKCWNSTIHRRTCSCWAEAISESKWRRPTAASAVE